MENNKIICSIVFALAFASCSPNKGSKDTPKAISAPKEEPFLQPIVIREPLISMNLLDRNGLSETITSKERLKNFEHVNFLVSQPYQKVLRIFAPDKTGKCRSLITSYYSNGQIKQYLEIENGQVKGAFVEWHANGQKKLKSFLLAGKPDIDEKSQLTWAFEGVAKAWDEEGNIEAILHYCKGELDGESSYFHKNGAVAKLLPFSKGGLHGKMVAFASDGTTLLEETIYHQGEKEGRSLGFWESGKPKWQEWYKKGLLEEGSYFNSNGEGVAAVKQGSGKRASFDENGRTVFSEYKNGKEEGEITIFENSNLLSKYFVKNGLKHGTETLYFALKPFEQEKEHKDRLKISIDWFEGKIHGMVKTWFDNGNQESSREMSQNMKSGVLTAWYRNGSLMMIEEYDKDKLIKGQYLKKDESTPISRVDNGTGIATLFDEEGRFSKKIRYKNSKPIDEQAP